MKTLKFKKNKEKGHPKNFLSWSVLRDVLLPYRKRWQNQEKRLNVLFSLKRFKNQPHFNVKFC